jgi:hypothetical protein
VVPGIRRETVRSKKYNDLLKNYSHGFISKSREILTTVKLSTQGIEIVWRQKG